MISRRNISCIFLGCLVSVLLGCYFRPEIERITSNTSSNRFNQESRGDSSKAPFDYDIIGIEFGDSYSRVALSQGENGNVTVILDEDGKAETPSVVAFTNKGVVVGRAAQMLATKNPKNTISNFRPLIGGNFSDPAVQEYIKSVPYDVIEKDERLHIRVELKGQVKLLTPEEVLAHLLLRMKEIANNHRCPSPSLPDRFLGIFPWSPPVNYCNSITQGVIAVPSYFDDIQRQAIKDSGMLAGIEILRVVNEPTAASIAHGIDSDTTKYPNESVFLVYNLAHKQLDLTLLDIDYGVYEILQSNSTRRVRGEDFDNALFNYLVEKYYLPQGVDVLADPKLEARLKNEAIKAENRFTESYSHEISLDRIPLELPATGIFGGASIFLDLFTISNLYNQLFINTTMYFPSEWSHPINPLATNITKIDGIILLGEPSTISKVRPFIDDYFGKEKIITDSEIPSNEAIARGVAKQGWVLSAYNEELDGCYLAMEIIPLSVGLELEGGIYHKIVPRNTVLPTQKRAKITTTRDDQTTISLWLYRGERPLTQYNEPVALLEITGIPPQPKGVAQVEIVFELGEDSMEVGFKARAIVLDTGEEFEFVKNGMLLEGVEQDEIDKTVLVTELYHNDDLIEVALIKQGNMVGERSARGWNPNPAALWIDPTLRDEL
ncbi:heat shock protein 70 family [Tricladium varicosporioides]|nr:heat shock protein 70 family [Hymenoscyphus varicosporioides]